MKNKILFVFPFLKSYSQFKKSLTNNVTLFEWIRWNLSKDKMIYWPVHKNSEVTYPQNIYVGINSNAATRPGCYLQGNGGIHIGNYVHFASNIRVISANHGIYEHMKHDKKEVRIGDYSWIGQNAIILPGVVLGERTIVAAGAVVTKSFPDGYVVLGGNPAQIIKTIERDRFVKHRFPAEYYGYVPKEKFAKFARKHLGFNRYYGEMVSDK